MSKIMISPGKYVQGAGELKRLGNYIAALEKNALVLISVSGQKRVGGMAGSSCTESGISFIFDLFNGECSKAEIHRFLDIMKANGCDVIIGIGGGKILDTAKAVAYYAKTPVVICPTISSTDAPCSALSVIYTDKGVFEEYLFLPENPYLVVMDTDVIAKSPARLTVSGMGDALATYFEARATKNSNGETCADGTITLAAMALSKLCYETLMSDGIRAKLALETGVCTPAAEN